MGKRPIPPLEAAGVDRERAKGEVSYFKAKGEGHTSKAFSAG